MVDTMFLLVGGSCYSQHLAPAAEEFVKSGSTAGLVKLLRAAEKKLGRPVPPLEGHLEILEGREFYGPGTNHMPPMPGAKTSRADLKMYVEDQVYPELFRMLCVARIDGVHSEQTLTRSGLLPYLYQHSLALEAIFTAGLRGEAMPMLHGHEVIRRSDLAKIYDLVLKVPAPNETSGAFEELKLMLKTALGDSKLAIVQVFE